jgi:hypothetical protein
MSGVALAISQWSVEGVSPRIVSGAAGVGAPNSFLALTAWGFRPRRRAALLAQKQSLAELSVERILLAFLAGNGAPAPAARTAFVFGL